MYTIRSGRDAVNEPGPGYFFRAVSVSVSVFHIHIHIHHRDTHFRNTSYMGNILRCKRRRCVMDRDTREELAIAYVNSG